MCSVLLQRAKRGDDAFLHEDAAKSALACAPNVPDGVLLDVGGIREDDGMVHIEHSARAERVELDAQAELNLLAGCGVHHFPAERAAWPDFQMRPDAAPGFHRVERSGSAFMRSDLDVGTPGERKHALVVFQR